MDKRTGTDRDTLYLCRIPKENQSDTQIES